uniref:Uncharacterized protein n=1 Tax=Sinocyclocheilus grahami TaxID=75366 RepID=A0A672K0G0_SINGR
MAENEILEDLDKLKRGLVKVLECVATISSAAAVVNPIFGVAGSLIRVVLHHVDDEDIQKLKREFRSVTRALDEISQQNQNVLLQIRKETVDGLYCRVEENIRNQFSKFMDTVEVSAAHEQRKKEFQMSFVINQCDQNLHTLYGGVMGESKIFCQPILEVYMKHSQGDQHVMENLCTRLTYLFCIGLIALMSYAASVGDDEEALHIEWEEKMKDVAKKMSEVLNKKCVDSFPEQSELAIKRLVKEKEDENLQEMAKELLDFLMKKYDWVSWSIRAISNLGKISNLRAGQNFQCVAGQNYFEVSQGNDTNLLVSFSSNPQPVPNESVKQTMEGPVRKGDAKAVVELLEKQLAGFLVHASVVTRTALLCRVFLKNVTTGRNIRT